MAVSTARSLFNVQQPPHLPSISSDREDRESALIWFLFVTDLRFRYRTPGLVQPVLVITVLRSSVFFKVLIFSPIFFYHCPTISSDIQIKQDRAAYGCQCMVTFDQPRCLRNTQVVRPDPLLSVAPNTFCQQKPPHGWI